MSKKLNTKRDLCITILDICHLHYDAIAEVLQYSRDANSRMLFCSDRWAKYETLMPCVIRSSLDGDSSHLINIVLVFIHL